MRAVAHRTNARINSLPPCPECGAGLARACATEKGYLCAPHRSRLRVAAGELFAISREDAKALHKLRELERISAAALRRAA